MSSQYKPTENAAEIWSDGDSESRLKSKPFHLDCLLVRDTHVSCLEQKLSNFTNTLLLLEKNNYYLINQLNCLAKPQSKEHVM